MMCDNYDGEEQNQILDSHHKYSSSIFFIDHDINFFLVNVSDIMWRSVSSVTSQ